MSEASSDGERRAKTPGLTVIGGYLGAGKTTVLNHLLNNAQSLRVAVLVNGLGSVNVDAGLVRRHSGETIDLANGCVCCSLAKGFTAALARIRARRAELDHVVVEACGVADPAKIALDAQARGFSLDGILVVADAEQIAAQTKNAHVGELVTRQLAHADLVVLNKVDLVSKEELASLVGWLHEVAPDVPQIGAVRGRVPVEMLMGVHAQTKAMAGEDTEPPEPGHPTFQAWTLACPMPLTANDLARFAGGLNDDIYRAKGFVRMAEDPGQLFMYQQVGKRWSVQKAADSIRDGVIVVIGRTGATTLVALQTLLGTAGTASAKGTTTRIVFGGGDY